VAKELADILAEYNQEKESVLEEEQEVLAEEKTILEKIDTCNKLKAEVSSKVDPGMMEEYEALVKRNLIPAAVAIGTSSCLGCAMAIPAQVFNDIIRDLSGKCPHCGRLLFYKELEKPEKEKKEKKKRATKKKPTKKKVTTKAEG
jgi:predicted  nucleic acid-binding Zn-ribbon protein